MSVNFPNSSSNDEIFKNKNINETEENYSNSNKMINDNNNNTNITDDKKNIFNSNNLLDDDENNLKFNSKLLLELENTPQQCKNQPDYKYSIDLQNNEKRIHEYLNNDLIKELDNNFSPNVIYKDSTNTNINNDNVINIKGKKIFNDNEIPNLDFNNDTNNNINNNNYNYNQNYNFSLEKNFSNNNNNTNNPININYRNKFDFINNNINNQLNNFENNNQFIYMNLANNQKTKPKKTFERREGDWICFNCNNLNFAFRKICNRCGITKEMSIKNSNLNKNNNTNNNNENNEIKKDINKDDKKDN
jgi:hypothetical protein